jgi:glutamine amidotransferase
VNVAIVASGGANLASLQFAVDRLGAETVLTEDPTVLREASHVLLPGVGAAQAAMDKLASKGLTEVIPQLQQPVLGICLGMQLLFASSAEDDAACLGIIEGRATHFEVAPSRPVPHMGWNAIEPTGESPLLASLDSGSYCYFVHSYALPVAAYTIATAEYGPAFSAAVQQGNFFGTQFHPERSGSVGAQILKNFLEL